MHENASDLTLVCVNLPGINSVIWETCKLMCLLLCFAVGFGLVAMLTQSYSFSVVSLFISKRIQLIRWQVFDDKCWFVCFCVTVHKQTKAKNTLFVRHVMSQAASQNVVSSKYKQATKMQEMKKLFIFLNLLFDH